jgi:hypothetical protein
LWRRPEAPTALPETRAFCALQAAATEQAGLTVIPGDYRIGATLLTVATFLGPGCHLWTQFLLHGVLGGFLCFQASRVRFRFSDTALDVVFIEPGASDATALAADTETSGDNKLQGGGANKWALSSITNWCAPRRRDRACTWRRLRCVCASAMTLQRSRVLATGSSGGLDSRCWCTTRRTRRALTVRCLAGAALHSQAHAQAHLSRACAHTACACAARALAPRAPTHSRRCAGQPHFFPIIMDGKALYETMLARMPPSLNAKPPLSDWNLDTALEATPVGASPGRVSRR